MLSLCSSCPSWFNIFHSVNGYVNGLHQDTEFRGGVSTNEVVITGNEPNQPSHELSRLRPPTKKTKLVWGLACFFLEILDELARIVHPNAMRDHGDLEVRRD